MSNRKQYNKRYYHNNKEYFKNYRDEHKEDIKKKREEYLKKYRQENRMLIYEKGKKYYQDNRIKIIERKYNLSYGTWLEMWESQNGECAICGEPFRSPNNAYVDHNHKTDEIRGLLCNNCNQGLGFFKDDLQTIEMAISYLTHNLDTLQCNE